MLLLGKTQKKHPGRLPPTVSDLPLHPCSDTAHTAAISAASHHGQNIKITRFQQKHEQKWRAIN